MDAEVVAQHLPRRIGEEGVAVVGLRRGQLTEDRELFVGDQKLGRREARELVIEQRLIGEFGHGELAGGMINTAGNVTFTKKLMLSANPPGEISKLVGCETTIGC